MREQFSMVPEAVVAPKGFSQSCTTPRTNPSPKRQHVVIKDALDLLHRALQALLEHTTAVLESQAVHRLEGVLLCEVVGAALVGPVHTGIGIWGDQPPRFVAQ